MAPPIAHRKQYLLNEMQARFCCPEKKTFTDTIELGPCLGLWVLLARILTQPLNSPRLHRCPCQGADGPATVSPLCDLTSSHVAPERLYLEARWSSLVPYAAAAGLLADVLPIASGANRTTVR